MSSDKITTHSQLQNITTTPVKRTPNSPTGTYVNEAFEPEAPVETKPEAPVETKPEAPVETTASDEEQFSLPDLVKEINFDGNGKYLGNPKNVTDKISRYLKKSNTGGKTFEMVNNNVKRAAKSENIKRLSSWLEKNSNKLKSSSAKGLAKNALAGLKLLNHSKKHDDIEYHKLKIKELEFSKKKEGESEKQFEDRKKNKIESHDNQIKKLKKEVRKEHEKIREEEEKHHTKHHTKHNPEHHDHHKKHHGLFEELKDDVEDKKDEDHGVSSFLDKVTGTFEHQNVDVLIYYSFISITIFTITLAIAYGNKDFVNQNEKLIKETRGFLTTGILTIAVFLVLLGLSIGKDRDIIQKLGSAGLLVGVFFVGGFFTYLTFQGNISVTGEDQLVTKTGVAIYIIFFLTSVAYVLFAKRSGDIARIIRICYCLFIVGAFFAIGGATASFAVRANLPKNCNEKLLFPFSGVLFGFGIFGTILVIISFIKPLNMAIGKGLNKFISGIEYRLVKVVIYLTFLTTIYLTIMLYVLYTSYSLSDYRIDDKMKLKDHEKRYKKNFRDTFIKDTCYAGFSLISYFVLSLAMAFGGTIKERLFSVFLVSFIIYLGSYFTYLKTTGKIDNLDSIENTITIATIVVFILLFLGSIAYVLFYRRSGQNVILDDILRLIAVVGAPILFLWEFAMIIAVMIIFAPSSEDKMHLYGWIAVGVSSFILVACIAILLIQFL